MTDLVELVPNVSEGRDQARLSSLGRVFEASGCRLLDTHSDPAHHRSVFTAAGSMGAAMRAALALAHSAVREIDMRRHQGLHPRIGAVDVIPFVRLSSPNEPSESLLAAVRKLANTLSRELEIPVFLYAQSSRPGGGLRLSELRRGGFERLDARLRGGELNPDFGPRRAHPTAGGIAVGVRDFLIAFNVFLDSRHSELARRIAGSIRESAGGLPALQAIGRFHDRQARAQISMNLLDYRRTSLLRAFEAVEELADKNGSSVLRSEIVGLVPEPAWQPEWQQRLRIRQPVRTIEQALRQAGLA